MKYRVTAWRQIRYEHTFIIEKADPSDVVNKAGNARDAGDRGTTMTRATTPNSGACVRSGFCCKRAPCPYGAGVPCVHLIPDPASAAGQYLCARYEYIQQQPGSEWSPAFGAGCSSTLFNEDRDRVLVQLRKAP